MKLLAERLRLLREARKWDQTEAAFRMGVTQQMLSNFERGKGDPSLSTLRKLAGGLNVTLAQLFDDSGSPPPARKPTPLEVALYLFENGAPEVDPKAKAIIKRALEADAAELAVLFENIEELFSGDPLDKSQSS